MDENITEKSSGSGHVKVHRRSREEKNNNDLVADLNLSILKKATKYQKEIIDKNKKENPYIIGEPKQGDSRKKN